MIYYGHTTNSREAKKDQAQCLLEPIDSQSNTQSQSSWQKPSNANTAQLSLLYKLARIIVCFISPKIIVCFISPNKQKYFQNATTYHKIHLWLITAAAAKSLQCDSIDDSPPGSPVPGILQARTLEWAAIYFSNAWKWNHYFLLKISFNLKWYITK